MNTIKSRILFDRAQTLIPGGVNSPVRAFKGVGGTPRFIDRGQGAYLFDVDGNKYVDYVQSWGPLPLGHAHPDVVVAICETARKGTSFGAPCLLEIELAELVIDTIASIEMLRFVSSGTEATMSAIRLARAVTGRDKIIKFAGNFHGHADMLLAKAGSGVATLGLPDSPGVPASVAANTLVIEYNDLTTLAEIFAKFGDDIAAVIVEPIGGNMGLVMPHPEFLPSIQNLCKKHGALFILDEVMTGFRVARGGAQQLFCLDPDITCLGKIIGGGLPCAAYAGKRHLMQNVAPAGKMYQSGTLSGNPLAMAAGLTTLRTLLVPQVFDSLTKKTTLLADGIKSLAMRFDIPMQVASVGGMFGFYFLRETALRTPNPINDYQTVQKHGDANAYISFFHAMLESGFYFAPSSFESGFLSTAHSDENIQATLGAIEQHFIKVVNTKGAHVR